jgi:hypothetical protein
VKSVDSNPFPASAAENGSDFMRYSFKQNIMTIAIEKLNSKYEEGY